MRLAGRLVLPPVRGRPCRWQDRPPQGSTDNSAARAGNASSGAALLPQREKTLGRYRSDVMRWRANTKGGWFDLGGGIMYRRGQGQKETNKRRPPAAIHENLMPHLKRWRTITTHGPVEYRGKLIQKERTGFERARELAGLGGDVTPHILKHTCITWLLFNAVPTWEVSDFTGTSEKTIRDVYGHHHPDATPNAKRRFRGHSLGKR